MMDTLQPASVRIGLLTMKDASDPRSWSGTPYFLSRSLEAVGADVEYIGPLDQPVSRMLRGIGKVRRRFGLSGTLGNQSRISAGVMARGIAARLRKNAPDVLFSPAGSSLISHLTTDLPIAYSSDATLRLVVGYYPEYSNLSARAIDQADALERMAITRADLLLYPTRWVADSAIRDYGADPAKIRIQPYGANLALPPTRADALAPRQDAPVRLLFVGVSWQRKGGDIALGAYHALRARGVDVSLTVIGCIPPEGCDLTGVTVVPFLDKNDPEQLQQLTNYFMKADLFLLPTRSECFGIVFCEAAAFGLPSITTATGGVPDVVSEGVNGFCLPLDADGPAYADKIEAVMRDPAAYQALRVSSRDTYESRLNWQAWAKLAVEEFQKLVTRG